MKKYRLLMSLIIGLSVMIFAALLINAAVKPCCVAGFYSGTTLSKALSNCPHPEAEGFKMEIKQFPECNSKISGTVTGSSGGVSTLSGTVTRESRGCCKIEGLVIDASGKEVLFNGKLCLVKGKWIGKGTYYEPQSSNPCKKEGTWRMEQI